MPANGTKNLIPVRTEEEAKRKGRKGGIASGKARREKRAMRDLAKMILEMPMRDEELDDVAAFNDLKKSVVDEDGSVREVAKNMTMGQAALFAQAQKAVKGDVAALAFLRDTAGEKPADQVEVSGDIAAATEDIKAMIAASKARAGG